MNAHTRPRVFWAATALAGLLVVGIAIIDPPHGDTDAPTGRRSGMRLHTDAATGCQYLSVPGGGITPRLGADRRPAGCRQ